MEFELRAVSPAKAAKDDVEKRASFLEKRDPTFTQE